MTTRTASLAGLLLAALASTAGAQAPAALTLQDATRLAWQRGVRAALARLGAEAAAQKVGQRRADLLPQVNGSASWTRQTLNLDEFGLPFARGTTDPFNLWRVRLGASQALVDLPALARLRAAQDSARAAASDAQAAGNAAAAAAGAAYVEVLAAEATVAARAADSVQAAELLRQARQLVASGVSPAIDATRSEVSFQAVRTQLVLARNDRDRARLALLRALELPLDTTVTLADSLGADDPALPATQEDAVALALRQRPEVAAEATRTRVAERSGQAVAREFLPSAVASGFWQESGQRIPDVLGTWNVQVGIAIPILDGWKRQRRKAEQAIRLDEQRLRARDVSRQVEQDARQAVLDLASAREQIAVAQDRVRLAELELAQAEDRFAAGVAGSVETTTAQRNVLAAKDALIQARLGWDLARIGAYRALGSLVPTP